MQSLSKLMPSTPLAPDSARCTVSQDTAVLQSPEDPSVTHVLNIGQVGDLALHGSWSREASPFKSTAAGSLQQFSLDGDPATNVCFFYRGHQLSQEASDAFRTVLALHPHLLDMDERKSILETLRDKVPSQDFAYCSIKTITIGLRMVLIVEGVYTKHNMRSITVFIDAAKRQDRAAIQELSFIAPRDSFYKNYGDIIQAFKTLKWA